MCAKELVGNWASLVAGAVKNLLYCFTWGLPQCKQILYCVGNPDSPWEFPLGWEDPLEEGLVTHSSVLAQRIPWTEEPGELQSLGLQRVRPKHSTARETGIFLF